MSTNAYLTPSGNGSGAAAGAGGVGWPAAAAGRGAGGCWAAACAKAGEDDKTKVSAAATAKALIPVSPFMCNGKCMILLQIHDASKIEMMRHAASHTASRSPI